MSQDASPPPPKAANPSARRVLALDLGEVRVGVAVSDPLGITAQPVETIAFTGDKALARRIAELCARWDVAEVLVGHPVGSDGRGTERAALAERFAKRLEPTIRRRVRLVDERFSTAEAERNLIAADLSREERRACIDQEAARIFLQSELDRRRIVADAP
ncbi:MAG: Holliday junction resolvase RuvX [Myxococcales bacterium]|nr:Holliday junction resolvase RuvX [Myxococcales bacterium]